MVKSRGKAKGKRLARGAPRGKTARQTTPKPVKITPGRRNKLDTQDLRGTILHFGRQIREGHEVAHRVRPPFKPDRVIVAGMGGSASYVDLVNHWLSEMPYPVYANRTYGLPPWANPRTLVIASSFSGDTEETLDAFDEALRRGCPVIAVSNGGKLEKKALAAGVPFVQMPRAPQPRFALGYFFGILTELLTNAGLARDHEKDIDDLADFLDREVPRMEVPAAKLASQLKGRIPLVYAPSQHFWTARICKIKFNENAKIPSFYNSFPELNHNEMVGMTQPLAGFSVLMLDDPTVDVRVLKRMRATRELFLQRGIPSHWVKLKGDSWVKRCLGAIAFCDFTSIYLAFEYGIDPAPVDMVEEFKKKIAKTEKNR